MKYNLKIKLKKWNKYKKKLIKRSNVRLGREKIWLWENSNPRVLQTTLPFRAARQRIQPRHSAPPDCLAWALRKAGASTLGVAQRGYRGALQRHPDRAGPTVGPSRRPPVGATFAGRPADGERGHTCPDFASRLHGPYLCIASYYNGSAEGRSTTISVSILQCASSLYFNAGVFYLILYLNVAPFILWGLTYNRVN